jgi:hypothetical protein
MTEWAVDLCSFTVEADTYEEALQIAIRCLETGAERAVIDQIIEL